MVGRASSPSRNSALIALIADEDSVVNFLIAGVGNVDIRRKTNHLIVDSKTTVRPIEDALKEFSWRDDIGIVLIRQYVSGFFQGMAFSLYCDQNVKTNYLYKNY